MASYELSAFDRFSAITLVGAIEQQAPAAVNVGFWLRDPNQWLLYPEPVAAHSRQDYLWQHTCCELFVASAGEASYREFNFSPSGQWSAYAFSAYRQAEESVLSLTPPVIISNLSAGGFVLSALLAPDALPTDSRQRPLRVGLCAVIESRDTLGYWALHHATERPDFHHPESFTLILP